MANIAKWNAPSSPVSALTTELDSLADGTMSSASSAIDNATNLDFYADVELNLGALSPAAGGYCTVYILEAIDGTNYPPATTALLAQAAQVLCTFSLDTTAATAQRITARNVIIPPGTFKVALYNKAGVALASSGNTVKLLPYNVNLNG